MLNNFQIHTNFCDFLILSLLYQESGIWTLDWKEDKIAKNLSCLTYYSHCFTIDQNQITIGKEKYGTKNICIFPFRHYDTTYNSCTKNGELGFWCATSVNADLEWQSYGYCNDLCPLEGMFYLVAFKIANQESTSFFQGMRQAKKHHVLQLVVKSQIRLVFSHSYTMG